jgi:hypothetical protein
MGEGGKIKQKPAQGASAPARPFAPTQDARHSATVKGGAKRRLPIRSSPVSTAPSLRTTLESLRGDDGEPAVVTPAAVAPIQRSNELVFVDSSTPHYESLIEDLRAAAAEGRRLEFVLIDAWRDGVHKISETLVQKKDLDAIHIVSHTRDGAVQLGSAQLDFDTLQKRTSQITAWCDALSANGDILLYGCDPAASEEGKALIEALLRLTGAEAAAGEEPADATAKDEDWKLEFKPGAVEAPSVSRSELHAQDEG